MIALWKALGKSVGAEEDFAFAAPEPMPECEPEMAKAFPQAIALLRRSGITIKAVDIAGQLKMLSDASDQIQAYEAARLHEPRLKEFGERLDKPLVDLIREGLKMPVERYKEIIQFIADSRRRFAEIFKSTPVILTPAAPGPAPLGLSTTGDPRMNASWTAMGNPALSIPMPVASGLPLGLQLTADLGQDSRVLRAALLLYQHFSAGPKILLA
jgi:Asp-tRNA(Asn)/Glu-tRNA(Gln) amidotransferase A subunit family amidase